MLYLITGLLFYSRLKQCVRSFNFRACALVNGWTQGPILQSRIYPQCRFIVSL